MRFYSACMPSQINSNSHVHGGYDNNNTVILTTQQHLAMVGSHSTLNTVGMPLMGALHKFATVAGYSPGFHCHEPHRCAICGSGLSFSIPDSWPESCNAFEVHKYNTATHQL